MLKKKIFILIGAVVIVLLAAAIGNVCIPVNEIFRALFLNEKGDVYRTILLDIRLPRVLNGFLTGGVLAVTGLVIQTIIKNPLGEPYMLGISSGAALGAVVGFVVGDGGFIFLPAFIFALSVSFLVYYLSSDKGGVNIIKLILTGVVINFLMSSIILLFLSIHSGKIKDYFFWTMGDLGNTGYSGILLLAVVIVIGLTVLIVYSRELDMIAINEESAYYSGVDTSKIKKIVFVTSSFMVSAIVSLNGIIGFVGIIIPHLVKILFRNNHKNLLFDSFIIGGVFIVICDTIGRSIISGTEIPVGVITSIIGAPVFLHILRKSGESS